MAMLINQTQSLVSDIYGYYLWTLTLSDSRTKGWLLVDSPLPTFVYTIIYLVIVWNGPRFMKNRSPYRLTGLLVPYNLSMAVLNGYICVQLFTSATRLKYSYVCQPCRANSEAL